VEVQQNRPSLCQPFVQGGVGIAPPDARIGPVRGSNDRSQRDNEQQDFRESVTDDPH
jgi:hypothetical protein